MDGGVLVSGLLLTFHVATVGHARLFPQCADPQGLTALGGAISILCFGALAFMCIGRALEFAALFWARYCF